MTHAIAEQGHLSEEQQEFWRRNARRYDRAALLLCRRFPQMAADIAADLSGSGRVLELGAGTGLVTERIHSRVGEVVATDNSPEMLAVLQERMTAVGATNVRTEITDAAALPYADGSFDAVVVANLLHLVPDAARVLREARRVLSDGGHLCAPTFAHGQSLRAQGVSRLLGLAGFKLERRLSLDRLATIIESADLVVDRRTLYPGLLPIAYVRAHRPRSSSS